MYSQTNPGRNIKQSPCLQDAPLECTPLTLQSAHHLEYTWLPLQNAHLSTWLAGCIVELAVLQPYMTTCLQLSMLPLTPGTHGQLDEVSSTALDGAVHCLPVSLGPCLLHTQPPARQSLDRPAPPPKGGDEPLSLGCLLCLLHKALHLHHECMPAMRSLLPTLLILQRHTKLAVVLPKHTGHAGVFTLCETVERHMMHLCCPTSCALYIATHVEHLHYCSTGLNT